MAERYVNYDKLLEERHRLGLDESSKIHKVNAFNNFIDNLPTADVAEAKHAEWVDDGFGRGNMICSGCGQYPVDDEDGNPLSALAWWQPDYCPNCGAKMDGRSDSIDS